MTMETPARGDKSDGGTSNKEKRSQAGGRATRDAAAAIDRKHGIFGPLALAATNRKKLQ